MTPLFRKRKSKLEPDPDFENLQLSLKAIDRNPPTGREGLELAGDDLAALRLWMAERFAAAEYEQLWHRRMALGYSLEQHGAPEEIWFWVNAFPALAALRLGERHHPFVATTAAFADEAYRGLGERDARVEEAMAEINERFFTR